MCDRYLFFGAALFLFGMILSEETQAFPPTHMMAVRAGTRTAAHRHSNAHHSTSRGTHAVVHSHSEDGASSSSCGYDHKDEEFQLIQEEASNFLRSGEMTSLLESAIQQARSQFPEELKGMDDIEVAEFLFVQDLAP